jgi:IS1 family transposase
MDQKADERDPLFAINLTFAKMRNDLARLGRKTWTTSKSLQGLERHLWLWVAWTNGYDLK